MDDLQLLIGISVTFKGFMGEELAIARKAHEVRDRIKDEKTSFNKNVSKLNVNQVLGYKTMMSDLKAKFQKRCEDMKGTIQGLKKNAEKVVIAYNDTLKRKACGQLGIDPSVLKKKKTATISSSQPTHATA